MTFMPINGAAEGGEEGTFMEIMLKTIFQSQEMIVGEKETIEVKTPFKFPKRPRRPKAVSFHGVEAPKAEDSLSWSLQLKRSSASTNVSVLNLTESDSFEFKTSETNSSSSSESEDGEASAESQNKMKNSGLIYVKDSVIDLKEKSSKLNHHVYSLKEKLSCISEKFGDISEKRESLNNLKYEILKDMFSLQGLLHAVESRSETALLRDLNQNIVSLCQGIKELQHSLETTGHRTEPGQAEEKQEMTILMTAIEEIRTSVAKISVNFETASVLLKNVQRGVFHMNTRIESFISQGRCAQEQQELVIDNI
ncbi:testis-specific serine kinase substrate isoform X3 [Rhinoderma darwinii]|uniref:testis-specific serine kinase substrate isoform X3 n=1 Tax=Rhinoderma darwinii TaxID=43563 RepID=UPI003F66BBD7